MSTEVDHFVHGDLLVRDVHACGGPESPGPLRPGDVLATGEEVARPMAGLNGARQHRGEIPHIDDAEASGRHQHEGLERSEHGPEASVEMR